MTISRDAGRILIVGAGPTGIGAAYRLKKLGYTNFRVIEASSIAGGLAASYTDDKGFTWDVGGHVQFSHYDYFDEAMDVVRMVLTGQVNREIVGLINQHGPFAVGMSGEDANVLHAERKLVEVDGRSTDIGRVGKIGQVNPGAVSALIADGRIPVLSSVARADDGGVYNVNADTAASALAVALNAGKLIMLTDVEGLFADYPDNTELISRLNTDELRALLPKLSSGMSPKMEACLHAVEGGVPQAHIIDGRVPHSLLLEVFTDRGIGTMVVDEALEAALLAGNGHYSRERSSGATSIDHDNGDTQ